MSDPQRQRDWSATDAQSDTEHFARYLGEATNLGQIKSYKERSHTHLGVAQGDIVLDAGCGIGDDALMLADRVEPAGRIIGVDNSEHLIERAKQKAGSRESVQFRVGDIYDLEFDADHFDVSRADRVLQHLDAPENAIAELVRTTSPGGRIGLTDPDWGSLVFEAPGAGSHDELLDPQHALPRHPEIGRRLYALAQQAGLIDISVDPFLLTSTDFDFVFEMCEIEAWAASMREAGVLSEQTFRDWVADLRRADQSDLFFGSLPAYTVTGTVPE